MSRFSAEQRVSRHSPCPVCGKADWCAYTSDGRFVLCQRLDSWNGRPAIRETDGGWLHALEVGSASGPVIRQAPIVRPTLGRPQLDRVYRRLAELCGLDEHARFDLIEKRRFPHALEGAAICFSLPASGRQNEEVSEALVAEFGLEVVERTPGFGIACGSCNGLRNRRESPCRECEGLGKKSPRFRSVRGGRHDYAVIGCDEDGLAFWGMSRKLPFDPATDANKYTLLSSSRSMEPSLSGLPKYHVAGRTYPKGRVWVTEGIVKAEITAWFERCPVIGLPGVHADEPTLEAIHTLIGKWSRCAS